MQLVILAAGMGSRFGGLKQMEPMDEFNNFLLDYSIYDAKRAGFDSVVFIIKKDFYEDFKNTIGKRAEKIIDVKYAFQDINDLPEGFVCPIGREKPWGTAHAIYAARDLIKEDFIIINGDDFYGQDAYRVAYEYLKSLPQNSVGKYANVAFKIVNTMTENGAVKRGVTFSNEKGFLTKLVESSVSKDGNGNIVCQPLDGSGAFNVQSDQLVSMNLFAFNVDLIKHLKEKFPLWLKANINDPKAEFLIPTVIDELVSEGKAELRLLATSSVWFGVTYKEDKPGVVKSLKALVDKGIYKPGLY